MGGGFQLAEGQECRASAAVPQWFAIHVRPRHEKKVAMELEQRGVVSFLPLVRRLRRWSDRDKMVDFPLFPCYAFVQIEPTPAARVSVLNSYGVLSFVGPHQGTPIPSSQIDDIRTLTLNDIPLLTSDLIRVGKRVRIRGGALDGMEGVLKECHGDRRLVISVDVIQRSVSLSVQGYKIEPA